MTSSSVAQRSSIALPKKLQWTLRPHSEVCFLYAFASSSLLREVRLNCSIQHIFCPSLDDEVPFLVAVSVVSKMTQAHV